MPLAVPPAIPASQLVNIIPSVLPAGGNALDLIGLVLTTSVRPPIDQVLSFADADDVADYFGPTSQEAALAAIYFNGPDNATKLPGALLFAQYPLEATNAYLRGGSISSMTLAQLQAIPNGVFTVSIDGGNVTSGTIDLSTATSFSSAAILIQDALGITGPDAATVIGSISGTTLTVTGVTNGTVEVGQYVSGTGVTADTIVLAALSGTGGVGTYTVSQSQTVPPDTFTMVEPGVYYDAVLGELVVQSSTTGTASTIGYSTATALATTLKLTVAEGAVLSQGAEATDPLTFMDHITEVTQNWASFMTTWEPAEDTKEDFATWSNSQRNRYVYEMWDTNVSNKAAGGPSQAVGFINAGQLSGISMIYDDPDIDTVGGSLAAFQMGWTASLDFTRFRGRQTAAFKSQSGLQPQIFSGTEANYLKSYGLNFYGDYTTANQAFVEYQPGTISGEFLWKDTYVDQIWLNNQLQLAIMVGLKATPAVPYNSVGYALIESWCMDPIQEAVNFGAIVAGVLLSNAQIAEINNAAGLADAATIVMQRGWFLQVKPAIARVRRPRTSPPITLWWADGGSVQKIDLASITVL